MVTEDARTSQAVLDELNDNGDPYYVAYVRDELKHDLVEVPQRSITVIPTAAALIADANADVEMQTIDGVDPDAPPGGGPGRSGAEKGKGKDIQGAAEEKVPAYEDEPRPYELL